MLEELVQWIQSHAEKESRTDLIDTTVVIRYVPGRMSILSVLNRCGPATDHAEYNKTSCDHVLTPVYSSLGSLAQRHPNWEMLRICSKYEMRILSHELVSELDHNDLNGTFITRYENAFRSLVHRFTDVSRALQPTIPISALTGI